MWLDALTYLFRSRGDYRIHSPFVYHFYQQVVKGKRSEEGAEVEKMYREMKASQKLIHFQDMGAGSQGMKAADKAVSLGRMARRASRRRNEGEFLLRLSRFCQAKRMLELGTHLGISAMYQQLGNPKAEIHSIEGSPKLAAQAQANFRKMKVEIEVHVGDFEEVLMEKMLTSSTPWPYVFVDGNHTYEASLRYFKMLLPHVPDGGLMVFDDIYWSKGHEKSLARNCRPSRGKREHRPVSLWVVLHPQAAGQGTFLYQKLKTPFLRH